MTGRWLVLVGVAIATLASPGDADAKKRPVCPGARFVVHEKPLFAGDPTVIVDGVTYMPDVFMVGVRSGCPLNPVKLKGKKKGTRVRGKWTNCTGATGKVKLKAMIDRTCHTMKGKLRAKKAKLKRTFVATLSTCGDGIVDREGGEQCDTGQPCTGGLVCGQTCQCAPGGTGTPLDIDLAVTGAGVEGHKGEAGTPVFISGTIENLGTVVVNGPWRDAVYLSRDDVFSRDDRKLAEFEQVLPLPAKEFYTFDAEVLLPKVPTGDFYLIIRTDDGNQISETNELNNALGAPIHIVAPNLVPTQLQEQPDRDNPRVFSVSWTVLNAGEAAAVPPWHDVLYLSADERLDASDTLIWPGDDDENAPGPPIVDPHNRYEQTVEVTLPEGVGPGNYYLILETDADEEIFEDSEDDNFVTEPIRVDD